MITRAETKGGRGPAVAGGLAAVVLVAMACEAPTPPPEEPLEAAAKAAAPAAWEDGLRVSPAAEPLVFIDGERSGAGKDAWAGLDPDRIERIEVLKPPLSLRLYGEEGAGGVIQIFLKGTRTAAPGEGRPARE